MDWFPTLLGLCGVKQTAEAPELDGYDLLPIIRNADAPSQHKTLHFAWGRGWAVREGDWKLINGKSLHNLADAKPEAKNYIKEKPEKAKALQALHQAWIKKVSKK